jgi:UPF0716 protein FxsA
MHLGKRIAIALLVLPIAEAAAFLAVAWAVGLWPALALMGLTSLAGGLVLRATARSQMARLRAALRDGVMPEGSSQGGGLFVGIGAILLLLPGFITDLVGAGLLVGPVRRRLGATFGRAIARGGPQAGSPPVIDLAPDEWRQTPERGRPPGD